MTTYTIAHVLFPRLPRYAPHETRIYNVRRLNIYHIFKLFRSSVHISNSALSVIWRRCIPHQEILLYFQLHVESLRNMLRYGGRRNVLGKPLKTQDWLYSSFVFLYKHLFSYLYSNITEIPHLIGCTKWYSLCLWSKMRKQEIILTHVFRYITSWKQTKVQNFNSNVTHGKCRSETYHRIIHESRETTVFMFIIISNLCFYFKLVMLQYIRLHKCKMYLFSIKNNGFRTQHNFYRISGYFLLNVCTSFCCLLMTVKIQEVPLVLNLWFCKQ